MLLPVVSGSAVSCHTSRILGMHVQVHQIKEIIYYIEVTVMFSTKELFSAMYEFHLFSFFRFSCRTVLFHLRNLLRKF